MAPDSIQAHTNASGQTVLVDKNANANWANRSALSPHSKDAVAGYPNSKEKKDAATALALDPAAQKEKEAKEAKDKKAAEEKKVPFSQLFRYADGLDKVFIFLGTVGAMLMGASIPVFSIVFGKLINSISPGSSNDDIAENVSYYASWLVIIGAIAFAGSFCEIGLYMMSSERQLRRLRQEFLKAMLRKNIGWFDQNSSGSLTSRLAADTKLVGEAIGEKVGTYIHFNTTFFVGLGIGFGYGWQLALVIIAVAPLLGGAGFAMTNLMKNLATKSNAAYAGAGAIADEAISNVRTVQAFGAEDRETARYALKLEDAKQLGMRSGLLNGLTLGITMAILFASYGLALWYGAKLVHDEVMSEQTGKPFTGGDVMTVFFSVLMGSMGIGQAAPSIPVMATGQGAAVYLFEIIDAVSPIDVYSDAGKRLKRADGVTDGVVGRFEFRDVHFRYATNKSKPILQGLNLSINPGEKVALVGSSGCGKSTIIQLLERFYDPDQGTVLIDGVDLKELNVRWWREQVGLVSQEPVLFAGSIRDNLMYGKPGATEQEMITAAKAANCHDFISTELPEGYNTLVGDKGKLLSGGQKQRIAIARAILKNPTVLLLDEATSALDTQNEKDVQGALDKLMAGRTTIIVAHRLSTVRDSDRIFVLGGGQVLESGSHVQLMALNSAYARLVEAQEQKSKEAKDEKDTEGSDEAQKKQALLALQAAYFGKRKAKEAAAAAADEKDQKTPSADQKSPAAGAAASPDAKSPTGGDAKSAQHAKDSVVDAKEKLPNVAFSRVFSYSAPEWQYFTIGVVCSLIQGATFPLFSFIFSEMITIFFAPRDEMMGRARDYALLFGALALGMFLISSGTYWALGIVSESLTYRLRRATFRNIMRQNIGYFDDKRHLSGILVTRLATDAATVHGLASSQLPKNVQMLTTLGAGIGIAFAYGWQLTLVVLAVMPLIIIAGSLQFKFMAGFSTEGKAAYENANRVANEAIAHIRTVASFTGEAQLLERFHHLMDGVQAVGMKGGVVAGLGFAFSNFILFAAYALSFWYGAQLIRDGTMSFNQVLKVFFAIVMSAMGVGQTAQLAPDAAKAQIAANAVFDIIDTVPPIDTDRVQGTKAAQFEHGGIQFKGVHFHYPTRPDVQVFNGLDMVIAPRTTVALVGASGSGKSTVIQMLQRFYDPCMPDPAAAAALAAAVAAAEAAKNGSSPVASPAVDQKAGDAAAAAKAALTPEQRAALVKPYDGSAGEILIDGESLHLMNITSLRNKIGIVSQEPVLFSGTIAENLRYGSPNATDEDMVAAARDSNIHDFICSLKDGYNSRLGAGGIQLSGGEKQRIAIARAVIRKPTILLLDEATSALDSKSEVVVQAALDNVMRGRTTIVIAHRLSTIRNANQIIVLERGVIKEQGNHDSLLKMGGIYAQLSALSSLERADGDH